MRREIVAVVAHEVRHLSVGQRRAVSDVVTRHFEARDLGKKREGQRWPCGICHGSSYSKGSMHLDCSQKDCDGSPRDRLVGAMFGVTYRLPNARRTLTSDSRD